MIWLSSSARYPGGLSVTSASRGFWRARSRLAATAARLSSRPRPRRLRLEVSQAPRTQSASHPAGPIPLQECPKTSSSLETRRDGAYSAPISSRLASPQDRASSRSRCRRRIAPASAPGSSGSTIRPVCSCRMISEFRDTCGDRRYTVRQRFKQDCANCRDHRSHRSRRAARTSSSARTQLSRRVQDGADEAGPTRNSAALREIA